jgi:hypothetical protein
MSNANLQGRLAEAEELRAFCVSICTFVPVKQVNSVPALPSGAAGGGRGAARGRGGGAELRAGSARRDAAQAQGTTTYVLLHTCPHTATYVSSY